MPPLGCRLMESLLTEAASRKDVKSLIIRLNFLSASEDKSDKEVFELAKKYFPEQVSKYSSYQDLQSFLQPEQSHDRDVLLKTGQQCNETLSQYFKRMKFIVSAYFDEEELSCKEFVSVFSNGIHESIREQVLEKLLASFTSLPSLYRNLKSMLSAMEAILVDFNNQGKCRWVRPRNFCYSCRKKTAIPVNPYDLDDVEECLDDM